MSIQRIIFDIRIDFEFYCPFCGHQLGPPKYPYCKHVIFVHMGSHDEGFFDYIRPWFAEAYLNKIKGTAYWQEYEFKKLSASDIKKFLSGNPGSMAEQKITLLDIDLVEQYIIPEAKTVLLVSLREQDNLTPCQVHIGLELGG